MRRQDINLKQKKIIKIERYLMNWKDKRIKEINHDISKQKKNIISIYMDIMLKSIAIF
jgi:hypothetical protein